MESKFRIIPPDKYDSTERQNKQSFWISVFSQASISLASMTFALSIAQSDISVDPIYYNPIFPNCDPYQVELVAALGEDYTVQNRLLQKLENLKSSLNNNWNGENDLPIEDKAYYNTKTLLLATPGNLLKYWRLFPNPNGTLLLSPKDSSIAGISIGNEEFSYAAFVSDDKQISGKEPFDVLSFNDALKQIHRILGYV